MQLVPTYMLARSLLAQPLSDVAFESYNCGGVQGAKMGVADVVETYRVPWWALVEERSRFISAGQLERNVMMWWRW